MTQPVIEQWIDSVCAHAGWDRPQRDGRDRYRFRLEQGLTVDASAPDQRTLGLAALIASPGQPDFDALVFRAATAVVPRAFKDGAVVSLDPDTGDLCLHAQITLGALRASEFPGIMERFLNELAFYRAL